MKNKVKNTFAEMKKPVIFVTSITSKFRCERQKLAQQKAGFFRIPKRGKALFTCRGVPVMGSPVRAERLVLDSGKGITLFLCPKLNVKYHAHHRTTQASRCACQAGHRSRPKHPKTQTGYQVRKVAPKAACFRIGGLAFGSTVIPHSLHFFN